MTAYAAAAPLIKGPEITFSTAAAPAPSPQTKRSNGQQQQNDNVNHAEIHKRNLQAMLQQHQQ